MERESTNQDCRKQSHSKHPSSKAAITQCSKCALVIKKMRIIVIYMFWEHILIMACLLIHNRHINFLNTSSSLNNLQYTLCISLADSFYKIIQRMLFVQQNLHWLHSHTYWNVLLPSFLYIFSFWCLYHLNKSTRLWPIGYIYWVCHQTQIPALI